MAKKLEDFLVLEQNVRQEEFSFNECTQQQQPEQSQSQKSDLTLTALRVNIETKKAQLQEV